MHLIHILSWCNCIIAARSFGVIAKLVFLPMIKKYLRNEAEYCSGKFNKVTCNFELLRDRRREGSAH